MRLRTTVSRSAVIIVAMVVNALTVAVSDET